MYSVLSVVLFLAFGTRPLQNPSCFEVIQSVADIDQAIDDDVRVAAAICGIDAVAGLKITEWLEGRVVVAEGLDENGFEFACFGGGEKRCADPTIVGAEAATGGFG